MSGSPLWQEGLDEDLLYFLYGFGYGVDEQGGPAPPPGGLPGASQTGSVGGGTPSQQRTNFVRFGPRVHLDMEPEDDWPDPPPRQRTIASPTVVAPPVTPTSKWASLQPHGLPMLSRPTAMRSAPPVTTARPPMQSLLQALDADLVSALQAAGMGQAGGVLSHSWTELADVFNDMELTNG
jgi:hypothetical protein